MVEERPGEVAEGGGGGREGVSGMEDVGRGGGGGQERRRCERCQGDGLLLMYRTLHCVPQPLNMRQLCSCHHFYPTTYFSVIVQSKLA